jgi:hypothetical protein
VQFQGMFAEYEKAQILERYRRGKTHRARAGSVNVLGGAPYGYRYPRRTDHTGAIYEIAEHEATLVAEMFRRYADDGASIAELTRWLTDSGVPTRTGKTRWDRSVVWAMLRNPAYAGRAVFGKTMVVHESAALNRVARSQGRSVGKATKTVDRPREEWIEIPVPAIVGEQTFDRVQQRLADNKRSSGRGPTEPSLPQSISACSACGYGYCRTSTRTTNKKIYYYRCLGSDNYRYEGGRVCDNKPVRADYLDSVVRDHITGLLADPQLIRDEIDKRLNAAKTSDPVVTQRKRLETGLAKARAGIAAMIEAFVCRVYRWIEVQASPFACRVLYICAALPMPTGTASAAPPMSAPAPPMVATPTAQPATTPSGGKATVAAVSAPPVSAPSGQPSRAPATPPIVLDRPRPAECVLDLSGPRVTVPARPGRSPLATGDLLFRTTGYPIKWRGLLAPFGIRYAHSPTTSSRTAATSGSPRPGSGTPRDRRRRARYGIAAAEHWAIGRPGRARSRR